MSIDIRLVEAYKYFIYWVVYIIAEVDFSNNKRVYRPKIQHISML